MSDATCSIDGCEKRAIARGWCNVHYHRWLRNGTTELTGVRKPMPKKPPEERFWKFVEIQPNGCWQWTGFTDRGYGRFGSGDERGTMWAYRWSYEHFIGPVPKGLHLDHFFCDNKACVNPEHVRPVTQRENTLRSDNPASWNLAKTHCPQGHPYAGDNLIIDGPSRRCRICRNANQKRRADRKRAELAAQAEAESARRYERRGAA